MPYVILAAFSVEVMGHCQVKWVAKLALLAVLPMKCFVFLSTVNHYNIF
jgi:hypothetical protein